MNVLGNRLFLSYDPLRVIRYDNQHQHKGRLRYRKTTLKPSAILLLALLLMQLNSASSQVTDRIPEPGQSFAFGTPIWIGANLEVMGNKRNLVADDVGDNSTEDALTISKDKTLQDIRMSAPYILILVKHSDEPAFHMLRASYDNENDSLMPAYRVSFTSQFTGEHNWKIIILSGQVNSRRAYVSPLWTFNIAESPNPTQLTTTTEATTAEVATAPASLIATTSTEEATTTIQATITEEEITTAPMTTDQTTTTEAATTTSTTDTPTTTTATTATTPQTTDQTTTTEAATTTTATSTTDTPTTTTTTTTSTTDTPITTTATTPQAAQEPVVYGLQPSCFQMDSKAYNICLALTSLSGGPEDWMRSFTGARKKWESVITGDDSRAYSSAELQRILGSTVANYLLPPTVDDVYISGAEQVIDGVNGILGSAGPVALKQIYDPIGKRTVYHPVIGRMIFDTADILSYQSQGLFSQIVLHEMAHTLGFGSLWSKFGLADGERYLGRAGNAAWQAMGCGSGTFVPIETDGGAGTAGGHWDDYCLQNEIMTGYIDPVNILSNMTVASFYDMAYVVDFSGAETYTMANMKNDDTCRKYCPGLPSQRRELQKNEEALASLPPLSEALRQRALAYGRQVLRDNALEQKKTNLRRRTENDSGEMGSEDLLYVGSDHISVFVMENFRLHTIHVENDDGKHQSANIFT